MEFCQLNFEIEIRNKINLKGDPFKTHHKLHGITRI